MNSSLADEIFNKAVIANQQGQLKQAAQLYIQAANQNQNDLTFLMKIAQNLEQLQRPYLAVNVYQDVLRKNMRHAGAYLGLGRTLIQLGCKKEGVQSIEQASKLQPENIDIFTNLSYAYWLAGENEKGVEAIKQAYRFGLKPESYFVNLINHYERNNQLEELSETLTEGLEVCPDNQKLLVLSGAYHLRMGDPEKALELLLKVEGKIETYGMNLRLYFELGKTYDKLGKYRQAYSAFVQANNFSKASAQLKNRSVEKDRKYLKNVEGMDFSDWDNVVADTLEGAENNPIFLVGFPRSGTTLLNRILDSHKDLECVEEENVLFYTKRYLTQKYGGYFHALKNLNKEQLNELRDHYLKRTLDFRKTGKGIHMVEKFPLMLVEIPFIKKIFPKSKIILALRHPCDCTLSCFMQNFDLNQAMLNCINLDDATSYYHDIMSHWLLFCNEMPFDHYQFKYEDLVQNQEKAIRNLVNYLELEWDPDIMNFTKKAAEIGRIKTPSYSQVVKPIYKDAKDRWRKYEEELAPYLNRLKPYCDFFGYKL